MLWGVNGVSSMATRAAVAGDDVSVVNSVYSAKRLALVGIVVGYLSGLTELLAVFFCSNTIYKLDFSFLRLLTALPQNQAHAIY